MATPAAILSILVEAQTGQASVALRNMQGQLAATNVNAASAEQSTSKLSRTISQLPRPAREAISSSGKMSVALQGVGGQLGQVTQTTNQTNQSTVQLSEAMRGAKAPVENASKSMGGLGKAATGLQAPLERSSSAIGALGKAAVAAGAAFIGFEAAKTAIESTGELAAATIKLSAVTGLDTKQASLWIEAMKVRGVATKTTSLAFITLSKNIRNAGEGSKTAVTAFNQLGIAAKSLPGESTEQTLLRVAQGLSSLKSPAERAAIAQQLFGRGAQALIPIFAQGRAGVDAMLAAAERYGAFLPKNVKLAEGAVRAQHNLNLAMDGLKIAFTEAVLPSLVTGATALLKFIAQMRSGTGVGGQFAQILKAAFGALKSAVEAVFPVFRLLASILLGLTHVLGTQLTGALVAVGVVLAVGNPLLAGIAALLIVLTHLQAVARGLSIVWGAVWGAIKRVTGDAVVFILGLFSTMLGGVAKIADVFSHLPGPLGAPFTALRHAAESGEHAIDRFRHKVSVWDGETKTYSASIAAHFETMASHVGASIIAARDAIHNGSRLAAKYAINNFDAIAGQIQVAMSSGQISTQEGAKLIAQALQDTLFAFGGAKIPGVGKVLAAAYPGLPKFTATSPALKATGGLIQIGRKGAGGRDDVPLNVGGMPIMVGEGEQVAVFTRHQQQVANQALAPYGGLPGLFNKVNKPNYMAAGGYVFPFGSGVSWGRTDEGVDFSGSGPIGAVGPGRVTYSNPQSGWYGPAPAFMVYQLTGGPDAGKLIYLAEHIANMAPVGAAVKAGQQIAQMTGGIEMGWESSATSPLPLAKVTSGYTEGQVTPAGSDFRTFLSGLAHGVITGGAFSGPVWKNILAPTVEGKGTIPDVVRAALGMMTGQANKFGASTLAGMAVSPGALPHFATGGFAVTGPVSWFTGGRTAYGKNASTDPGISLRIPGTHYSDPRNVALMGKMFRVLIQGHAADLMDIDLGPNEWTGRSIDVTAPGVSRMGFSTSNFPTNAIGTATELGGSVPAGTSNVPKSAKKPPKPKPKTMLGLKALAGKDMGPINRGMAELNRLMSDTGDVAKLKERYDAFDSLFQALHPNLQYLVQPAGGGAAYIDDAAVQDSLNELLQLRVWEQQIIADYKRAWKVAERVRNAIQVAIAERQELVFRMQAKIRDNLAKIAALEKHKSPVTQKAVGQLQADNKALGGATTKVGTGGRIGGLTKEIAALQGRATNVTDMLTTIRGLTGAGGSLAAENITLIGLNQQIRPLQDWVTSHGGVLATQLADAGGAGGVSAAGLEAQLALQQQLTQQAQQALAVSAAQYKTLAAFDFPPYGGSFAGGGVVPGPVGAPRVVIAHGGEGIGYPGDVQVNLHFANGMEWLRNFVRAETTWTNRGAARIAGRGLPGSGGGGGR